MKSDQEIQNDVIDELRWEPALNPTEIGIGVRNGIVTLSGYVASYSEKLVAEKAAKRVKGVRAVAQDIQVLLNAGDQLTDSQIAESTLRALELPSTIPDNQIRVTVDNGWVRLEGEVDWLFQKAAAENSISDLKGIRGIINQIKVKPGVVTAIVKDNIRKALERRADLEADKINIETAGTKVILRGSARSWTERSEVEKAAASAPGVSEVDDQLSVIYD